MVNGVELVVVGAGVSLGHVAYERYVFFVVTLQKAYFLFILFGCNMLLLHLLFKFLEPFAVVLLCHSVCIILNALLVGLQLFEVHHYYFNGYMGREYQFAPHKALVVQLISVFSYTLQHQGIAVLLVGSRYAEFSFFICDDSIEQPLYTYCYVGNRYTGGVGAAQCSHKAALFVLGGYLRPCKQG